MLRPHKKPISQLIPPAVAPAVALCARSPTPTPMQKKNHKPKAKESKKRWMNENCGAM